MMMLALILYGAAIITFARAHHWIPAVLLVVMFLVVGRSPKPTLRDSAWSLGWPLLLFLATLIYGIVVGCWEGVGLLVLWVIVFFVWVRKGGTPQTCV